MIVSQEMVSDLGEFGRIYRVTVDAGGLERILNISCRSESEIPELVDLALNPVASHGVSQASITIAIQAHLDTTARERNYDSIQSAITYRGDPNPQFAAEGDALFAWRSAVWTYATEQLAAVEAGEREAPETAEAFIEELPPFEWPVLEPSEA